MHYIIVCLIIIDINECASSPCEYSCTNTDGSFECSCDDGYALGLDGLSCQGTTVKSNSVSNPVSNHCFVRYWWV